ncbi:26S protease regulatory subunit 6B, putative [Ixodes scapularis]|uniref:26S protease regulatory subunit 6B, putative n=1 Tax=Ixodes scapularis TaxID=6945 RepID=B7P361_IXOSC|nr:26S protease regulatory subunit 6B, putative [Ixodes scapularis]|eukprot:XP_002403620.1 26S protease regulatory subunit 6B, putative [Ixodes scapularis]
MPVASGRGRVKWDEKPDIKYADIGGLDIQKQEIREAVELPLTHFELYKQIGIDPPRGVLMYGPPGCGKTMLAKAVAHHTTGGSTRDNPPLGILCVVRGSRGHEV